MKNMTLSELVVNAQADALAKMASGGFFDVFDGQQPMNADVGLTGQTCGVSLQMGSPAFGPAVDGRIHAHAMSGIVVNPLYLATWGRAFAADHATVLWDFTVGVGDEFNMPVRTATFLEGTTVEMVKYTHSVLKATPGN